MKNILIPIFFSFLVLGCSGGPAKAPETVQDIQPGDQSIIQPPDHSTRAPSSSLEEKNI